jgi:hypothetical protein
LSQKETGKILMLYYATHHLPSLKSKKIVKEKKEEFYRKSN